MRPSDRPVPLPSEPAPAAAPPAGGRDAVTSPLCVFNRTREAFVAMNVVRTGLPGLSPLLCPTFPLRAPGEDGCWLEESSGVHTFGVKLPVDLLFLDASNRVIEAVEHLDPFSIRRLPGGCVSVLALRVRAIYSSQTRAGDELIIGSPEALRESFERASASAEPENCGEALCCEIF